MKIPVIATILFVCSTVVFSTVYPQTKITRIDSVVVLKKTMSDKEFLYQIFVLMDSMGNINISLELRDKALESYLHLAKEHLGYTALDAIDFLHLLLSGVHLNEPNSKMLLRAITIGKTVLRYIKKQRQ